FFFTDTVTTEIYTLSYTTLFRSEDFYIDLEGADLTGQIFGVYGSADSFYDTYDLAIQLMGDRLKNLGATMIPDRFIVDLTPDKKDRKSTRLNSSHVSRSYAVFCS